MRNDGSAPAPVLRGIQNFRDIGGIVNAAGRRVRRGAVYRSELLTALNDDDLATLVGLRIGTVFDLRNPSERTDAPTRWPRPEEPVQVCAMPEELLVPGADMRQFMRQLREASLDVSHVRSLMLTTYRSMPTHFGGMLRRLFDALARANGSAALVHCAAGKDRTGFVCAMLLSALDVSPDIVMDDYLATARYYTVERLMAHMEHAAGRPLVPEMAVTMAALAQVKAEYLDAALAEIVKGWGSVPAYLQQEAGLETSLMQRLHARLLE